MIALALLLALQDPEAAFREGRYADAVALAEKALEARKTAEMLGLLGAARLKSGDAPGAVRALEEAVAMDGATSDLHRWLGRARLEAGRHDDAIASFEAAGDVLGVAQVHVAREDWGSAEAALRRAPSAPDALELLAYVLGRAGRAEEAAGVCRALARRAPADPRGWLRLGHAEAAARRPGPAIDALETARRLGGADDASLRLLADLYLQLPLPRQAAAAYRALRAPTPDDYYRLGHAHLLGGERASALEAFERAGAPGLLPRARHADDPAAARALYAEAAKATADPAPLAERGVFEMRHQAWAAAAEALDEAVRRGDRSLSTLYNRVLALRSAGRPEPALEALKEALREHPLDERLRSLLR